MCEPRQKNGEGALGGKREKKENNARAFEESVDSRMIERGRAFPIECFARVGEFGECCRRSIAQLDREDREDGMARGTDIERTFR